MRYRRNLVLIGMIGAIAAFLTVPVWGMGPAVFLDSERTVISRTPSPDGMRIVQVERIVVGGVPSIVLMVRPWWEPDWYLAGCAAASHYQDTKASVRWSSKTAIIVEHPVEQLAWNVGSAPFHSDPCDNLLVTFENKAS